MRIYIMHGLQFKMESIYGLQVRFSNTFNSLNYILYNRKIHEAPNIYLTQTVHAVVYTVD